MAKILLAEDNVQLHKRLLTLLKKEGHQVDVATTGDYALELLLNYFYDAGIIDWDLPSVQGPDICKTYRTSGGNAPLLFLTGKTDFESRVIGLDSGADDYLCKPFDKEELLARLRAMLRRTKKPDNIILKVGAIQYAPGPKTLMFNGKEVDATKKELAIIEFLLKNPNRIFKAEEIIARVWPSNSEVTPDTIRPYIKRLRDKLTDESGTCKLATVHGSGYLLVDP